MSRAEEDTEPREKSQKKPDHGPSLHDAVDGKAGSCKSLIFRSNRISMTDNYPQSLDAARKARNSRVQVVQGKGPLPFDKENGL